MTMIDTIILKFPISKFRIENIARFGTTKPEVTSGLGFYKKYQNNPDRRSLQEKGYQPRLTLYRRGRVIELKAEFSAPKIIYGNNLNELEDADLGPLVRKLKEQMGERGVKISLDDILNAEVSAFHASKNISLKGGFTAIAVIKELSKINLTQKLDLDTKDYKNGGHSLQYYSKSHALVMYDKIKDLKKPDKRAIDKENKTNQMSLFDFVANKDMPEVLRLEVRLSQKQKMNSVLKKLDLPDNPKLKNIFKKNVCQKIVKYYWENIVINGNELLFEPINSPYRIIQRVIQKRPGIKPKEALYLSGLYLIAKDSGIRNLREVLSPLFTQRNWYKISDDIRSLKLTDLRYGWLREIENQIEKFNSLKLPTWKKM